MTTHYIPVPFDDALEILHVLRFYDDVAPAGEGWQSDKLQALADRFSQLVDAARSSPMEHYTTEVVAALVAEYLRAITPAGAEFFRESTELSSFLVWLGARDAVASKATIRRDANERTDA